MYTNAWFFLDKMVTMVTRYQLICTEFQYILISILWIQLDYIDHICKKRRDEESTMMTQIDNLIIDIRTPTLWTTTPRIITRQDNDPLGQVPPRATSP